MKKKNILFIIIIILLGGLFVTSYKLLCSSDKNINLYEEYRSIIKQVNYGDKITYVIGHKSPDSDTVGSAIAYANLLNELGIKAEAVISADPNSETAYALKEFNYEVPKIINDATDKQFVLVDHSEYSHAIDNMEKARVVGIIDHHGIGDIANNELIYVRSAPTGATSTIIYYMYKECGVEISIDIARIMLMSLISDTSNGTKKMTKADGVAYNDLVRIADIDVNKLYEGMTEARFSYDGMTDEEIFLSDYKEYDIAGKKIAMGCTTAANKEKAIELAKRMYDYIKIHYNNSGMNMLFFKIDNNDVNDKDKAYMIAYGENSTEILNSIFNNYDGNLLFVFNKSISRKTDIIPEITKKLER